MTKDIPELWQDKDTTRDLVRKYNSLVAKVEDTIGVLNRMERIPTIQQFVIGNGVDTTFELHHNLNSRKIIVQVAETNAPYEVVLADIKLTDTHTVTIEMNEPPNLNQYTVTVLG